MSQMDGQSIRCLFRDRDQIICKTYMTRVEGENTRLRHYLARLHRQTLCYSKSTEMLAYSVKLLIALRVTRHAHYLKFWDVPIPVYVNNFSCDRF
jgi:insertion element IS1 protein InsB